MDFAQLKTSFSTRPGGQPEWIARAPGRVNLIGEHTDYNLGLVLPMAIDRKIEIAFRVRTDNKVGLRSLNFDQSIEFSTTDLKTDPDSSWADYVKAAAYVLLQDGHELKGVDAVVFGDVPPASGLSSSAALEVASLLMFQQSSGLELGSPLDIAKLAQRAENEFVGVKCGLMDQLISAAGQADHAMSINFTTLEMNSVRVPDEIAVVVGDTKLSRKLAGSTYNVRRTECEEAVAIINSHRPESKLASLSDLDEDYFGQIQSVLTGKRLQRARHVVTENQRVRSSLQALRDKDFERLGVLFSESHASLRDDYEVSSEGLNRLVETMEAQPECWGARLTGAGFGGCTIAIVPQESAHRFIEKVVSNCTGFETKPDLFITLPSNGGQVFPVE